VIGFDFIQLSLGPAIDSSQALFFLKRIDPFRFPLVQFSIPPSRSQCLVWRAHLSPTHPFLSAFFSERVAQCEPRTSPFFWLTPSMCSSRADRDLPAGPLCFSSSSAGLLDPPPLPPLSHTRAMRHFRPPVPPSPHPLVHKRGDLVLQPPHHNPFDRARPRADWTSLPSSIDVIETVAFLFLVSRPFLSPPLSRFPVLEILLPSFVALKGVGHFHHSSSKCT